MNLLTGRKPTKKCCSYLLPRHKFVTLHRCFTWAAAKHVCRQLLRRASVRWRCFFTGPQRPRFSTPKETSATGQCQALSHGLLVLPSEGGGAGVSILVSGRPPAASSRFVPSFSEAGTSKSSETGRSGTALGPENMASLESPTFVVHPQAEGFGLCSPNFSIAWAWSVSEHGVMTETIKKEIPSCAANNRMSNEGVSAVR